MQPFKTIRKVFRIISLDIFTNLCAYVMSMFQAHKENQEVETIVTVEVMSKERARSVAQNSLYWKWVTIIGGKDGNTKEQQHTILKRAHLVKIYQRDDLETAETVLLLNEAKKHMSTQEYERLAQGVARLFSTTKASTKQMGEYLHEIYHYYNANGLALPQPDDYHWIRGDINNTTTEQGE